MDSGRRLCEGRAGREAGPPPARAVTPLGPASSACVDGTERYPGKQYGPQVLTSPLPLRWGPVRRSRRPIGMRLTQVFTRDRVRELRSGRPVRFVERPRCRRSSPVPARRRAG
jgi:hypothetical protein